MRWGGSSPGTAEEAATRSANGYLPPSRMCRRRLRTQTADTDDERVALLAEQLPGHVRQHARYAASAPSAS